MKKLLAFLLVVVLCLGAFTACNLFGDDQDDTKDPSKEQTPSDTQTAAPTVEEAASFLYDIYKDDNGKETISDFDLAKQVALKGTTFPVSWAVDCDKITLKDSSTAGYITVDLPNSNDTAVDYTLTATVSDADGKTAVKTFTRKLPVYAIVTIAEALELPDDSNITVSGTVVAINQAWDPGYNNISVTIEDESGNQLYIYRLATNVEKGDIITVTGTMTTYSGKRQVAQGATAVITGHENLPEARLVTIPEFKTLDDNTEIIVKGTVLEINTAWDSGYKNITVTIVDAEGNTLYVYRLATNVKAGDVITITGLVGSYNGAKQVAQGATAVIDTTHTHAYTDSTVNATCEEKGYTKHTCTCGYYYADNYTELASHADANSDGQCDNCYTYISASSAGFVSADLGLANATDFTEKVVDSITFAAGAGTNESNTPKFYTSGNAVRFYAGNTFTVSAATGYKILRVVITTVSGDNGITTTNFSVTNATATGVGTTEVVLVPTDGTAAIVMTNPATSGNFRIVAIDVQYAEVTSANDIAPTTADGEFTATVTTGYSYDKYTFKAPVAGWYTFTIPAGLTVAWDSDLVQSSYGQDGLYVDMNDNMEGTAFSIYLEANEVTNLHFTSFEAGEFTIAYTDDADKRVYPKIEIEAGYEATFELVTEQLASATINFTVYESGLYSFTSANLTVVSVKAPDGTALTADADGRYALTNMMWSGTVYYVEVKATAEDATAGEYSIKAERYIPLGSSEKPEEFTLGDTLNVNIAAGESYYYTFTATATGHVTFTAANTDLTLNEAPTYVLAGKTYTFYVSAEEAVETTVTTAFAEGNLTAEEANDALIGSNVTVGDYMGVITSDGITFNETVYYPEYQVLLDLLYNYTMTVNADGSVFIAVTLNTEYADMVGEDVGLDGKTLKAVYTYDSEYDYYYWAITIFDCTHSYTADCDVNCNVCGAERATTIGHSYDNACDANCNACGAERTPADHEYDNACDANCNVCNAARTPADHEYDNACDANCNVCNAARTPADHSYTDHVCTVCGADDPDHYFEMTIAEAIAADDGKKVSINATVASITTAWSDSYGNITVVLKDSTGTLTAYRLATNVTVGDIVTVTGTMATHSSNRQIAAGATATITGHDTSYDYVEMTIAEAIAAGAGANVIITGTVDEITTAYSSSYNNISVYINDGEGNRIQLYRLTGNVGLGDVIKVKGSTSEYSGAVQIGAGATFEMVTEHVCSTYTEATCTAPAKCTVCGTANGDVADHTFVDGTCSVCGATEGAEPVTVSKTIAELITANGWTNTTIKQSFTLDDVVSVNVNGGSNSGKAYSDHIRIYATDSPAGSLTISVAEGYELVSVKISAVTGTYAFLYVDGTTTDICNQTVSVSGSSVLLNSVKNGSDGKQVRVTAIEVVYKPV